MFRIPKFCSRIKRKSWNIFFLFHFFSKFKNLHTFSKNVSLLICFVEFHFAFSKNDNKIKCLFIKKFATVPSSFQKMFMF